VITAGHAFVQNVRRGYYELAVEAPAPLRLAAVFGELASAMCRQTVVCDFSMPRGGQTQL
jgi:hypothetical protein